MALQKAVNLYDQTKVSHLFSDVSVLQVLRHTSGKNPFVLQCEINYSLSCIVSEYNSVFMQYIATVCKDEKEMTTGVDSVPHLRNGDLRSLCIFSFLRG